MTNPPVSPSHSSKTLSTQTNRDTSLTQKVSGAILITGCSGGIGFELAKHLCLAGHQDLFFHYRSSDKTIKDFLKEFRPDLIENCLKAELTDEIQVQQMLETIRNRKPIWAVLNVAGASTNKMSWKLSKTEFSKVIDDNLTSAFLVAKESARIMRDQNIGGRLIQFSSVVAHMGTIGASHYCAAKAGLEGLTKALARELAPKRITVNAIALGYFEVGLIKDVPENMIKELVDSTPAGRLGTGQDVSALTEYLLSKNSDFMTGQTLHLSGGLYL